mgnify:CR=1 FL=1
MEQAWAGQMAITIYGIRNCDTMKKARAWLEDNAIGHGFHDYKAAGIDRHRLEGWCRRETGKGLLVGFEPEAYKSALG